MTAQKKGTAPESGAKEQEPAAAGSGVKQGETGTDSAANQEGAADQSGSSKRKPWVKKTPTEIVLEQVSKQEEVVTRLKKELAKEEAELKKMQKAAEIFQAG
jgi:hypothetical protein